MTGMIRQSNLSLNFLSFAHYWRMSMDKTITITSCEQCPYAYLEESSIETIYLCVHPDAHEDFIGDIDEAESIPNFCPL